MIGEAYSSGKGTSGNISLIMHAFELGDWATGRLPSDGKAG